jgi:hypothetical protein
LEEYAGMNSIAPHPRMHIRSFYNLDGKVILGYDFILNLFNDSTRTPNIAGIQFRNNIDPLLHINLPLTSIGSREVFIHSRPFGVLAIDPETGASRVVFSNNNAFGTIVFTVTRDDILTFTYTNVDGIEIMEELHPDGTRIELRRGTPDPGEVITLVRVM